MALRKLSDMLPISGNWPATARYAVIAGLSVVLLLVLIIALRTPFQPAAQTYDIRLSTLKVQDGIEVTYRALTPVERMTFAIPAEAFDFVTLTEPAEGVAIGRLDGRIAMSADDPVGQMRLVLKPGLATPEKATPVAQFGVAASAVNLAALNPVAVEGQDVSAISGGETGFRWFGPAATFANQRIQIFEDPGLPLPVARLLAPAADAVADHFARGFDLALPAPPEMMLLYQPGNAGQLSVEGDTLPGQSLIKYTGGAFANDTPEMRALVLGNLAHEMVHLWQLEQAGVAAMPDWLYEGAADALAAEALYVSGVWDDDEYLAALTGARAECAEVLRSGTVRGAASRGHHRVSYACGHMAVSALAAQQQGGTAMAMWRAFTDTAAEPTDEAFFDFAASWAGSGDFANSLRTFVTADYRSADGAAVVDRLFAGAL